MAPFSSSSPSLPPPRSHLFTPIEEGNESEETTDHERRRVNSTTPTPTTSTDASRSSYHHQPTPLHNPTSGKPPTSSGSNKPRRKEKHPGTDTNDRTVSCNNCRPTPREKSSVVVFPVDSKLSLSPSIFKSIISGMSRKSPKLPEPSPAGSHPSSSSSEKWQVTVAELSHKLVQVTRKRDEAVLEASRVKYSMAELEKKLNRLESYCHNLKSSLDMCSNNSKQFQLQVPVSPSPTRTR